VPPIVTAERSSRAGSIGLAAFLGAVAGVLSAAILDWRTPPASDPLIGWAMVSAGPGALFGVVLGSAFSRRRLLRWWGVASFAVAAALSHALAFHSAFFMLGHIEWLLGRDSVASFAVTGTLAGAIGGGLLAAASAFLLPLARWPWLMAAGALLGAFLPLGNRDEIHGIWLFYVLWQVGYGAALAVALTAPPAGARD
jgi:hypothetical protein